ncbi:hypothetical protein GobsT_71790 [Gemmata obscuriglobus]|nr:DUF1571 domain-containing protein [Gemmata obscuriglobus]QEG32324.1 hypothetical protein GobsT_71790 [Gemmata obscuriglobus]VTS11680.1 Uncharacterized protein OS=Singulisphaera acidiphila (strain ATCC BAA-1392 / DSM 18658 / VKM B-2454 / MOB10) GN=Sinac_6728 PE=4 SV=1: DUF1571 [Gemmata obscuriglobus UQM 2246]
MRAKAWLAVAFAGVLGVGAVVAQPPKGGAPKTEAPKAPEGAKITDPLATMIAEAKGALGKTRDYTCTFTRQEVVKGALSAEQVAEMKVRLNPGGVYVRFARPDAIAGMEVAYTAARKNDKFRYRPAGVGGAKGFRTLDLDDSKFLAENRHPVADWTMSAVVDRVATAAAREKALNNPVEVYTGDFQFAGRNVTRYEIFTRRPHAFRHAHRTLVYVDKETKLPLRYEAYDQPKSGAAVGDLFEAYSFSDVKRNVGLGEAVFDL